MILEEKCFSCYVLTTVQISLSGCIYFLGYWAFIIFHNFSFIIFEINLIFLIKPFLYMTKLLRKKFEYLENKKSFAGEMKSILHHFKGFLIAKNCLWPESAPLTHSFLMYLFSTLWKYHKTLRLSDVFRGQRKAALGTNGLKYKWQSDSLYTIGHSLLSELEVMHKNNPTVLTKNVTGKKRLLDVEILF